MKVNIEIIFLLFFIVLIDTGVFHETAHAITGVIFYGNEPVLIEFGLAPKVVFSDYVVGQHLMLFSGGFVNSLCWVFCFCWAERIRRRSNNKKWSYYISVYKWWFFFQIWLSLAYGTFEVFSRV